MLPTAGTCRGSVFPEDMRVPCQKGGRGGNDGPVGSQVLFQSASPPLPAWQRNQPVVKSGMGAHPSHLPAPPDTTGSLPVCRNHPAPAT